jgi:hypothetical protein
MNVALPSALDAICASHYDVMSSGARRRLPGSDAELMAPDVKTPDLNTEVRLQ